MVYPKLTPKNLDEMRESIAASMPQLQTKDAAECRNLISKCEDLENKIVEQKGIFTIEQASDFLGVSKQTLRNWENSGKLVPHIRTSGGHRRYLESQITPLRKKQLSVPEIILPDVTPEKLRSLAEMLLANFKPNEKINLIVSQGIVDGKVRITIDSEDGLTTVCKTFNMED